jgi:hypothetical protein
MHTPVPSTRPRWAASLAILLAVAATGACSARSGPAPSGSPTGDAALGTAAAGPSDGATLTRTTSPPGTATPAAIRTTPDRTTGPTVRARGDLTIHLAGGCTWYQDSLGELWLDPTLAASWTGPAPFPSTAFSMTSNYGKHTAGGPVTSSAPFTWAIGGEPTAGNAFLGHTVKLTVTIDPGNSIVETNEGDNVAVVTVTVPATPPPSTGTVLAVPCG